MFSMLFDVIQVDENVVEINYHVYIDEVMENIIHEVLKGCGCICESKQHNKIFKRAVASVERSLPLVSFSYPHVVISHSKVDL